jgi:hypothetical protein
MLNQQVQKKERRCDPNHKEEVALLFGIIKHLQAHRL